MNYKITYGKKEWTWFCNIDPDRLDRMFELDAEKELQRNKTGGGSVFYQGNGTASICTGMNKIGSIERIQKR